MLQKTCNCGAEMSIRMRTVQYTHKVCIQNVPILYCETCSASELYPAIKPDLKRLIHGLGKEPEDQELSFNELNEFANMLLLASRKDLQNVPIDYMVQERVNQLLDLMILARSLEDEAWERDIQNRLSQITNPACTR